MMFCIWRRRAPGSGDERPPTSVWNASRNQGGALAAARCARPLSLMPVDCEPSVNPSIGLCLYARMLTGNDWRILLLFSRLVFFSTVYVIPGISLICFVLVALRNVRAAGEGSLFKIARMWPPSPAAVSDLCGVLAAGLVEVIIYSSPDDKKKNRGFCFLEYDSHKAASLAKRRLGTGRIKVRSQGFPYVHCVSLLCKLVSLKC